MQFSPTKCFRKNCVENMSSFYGFLLWSWGILKMNFRYFHGILLFILVVSWEFSLMFAASRIHLCLKALVFTVP